MKFSSNFFPDFFTPSDRNGVLLALSFAICFFYVLVQARAPSRKQVKVPVAQVESQLNEVRYKESGTVSFYEITNGGGLQNEDEIFTGQKSSAKIRFLRSKTILEMPASSLIKIEESTSGETVEVKRGAVDLLLEKGKSINIRIDGKDHQLVSGQKSSRAKLFLSEGKLKIYSKEKELKLDGGLENESKNGFEVLVPMPGEIVEYSSGLRIKLDKKGKYNLQLSPLADFSQGVLMTTMNGSELLWEQNLNEGEYFLKIENNKESKILPLTFVSKHKIDGMVPGDGEKVNLAPGANTVLRWNPKPVIGYKVTLKDYTGKEHIFKTGSPQLVVNSLKGSNFEWSVVPEISRGRYSLIMSSARSDLNFIGKIEFVSGLKSKFKVTEKIKLNWRSSGGNEYLLRLTDENKNKVVLERMVKGESWALPVLETSSYRLEIGSVEFPGMEKAAHTFEVAAPILTWDSSMSKELRSPEENEEIELKFEKNSNWDQEINISLIHQAKNKKQTISKQKIKNPGKIKLDSFGEYCFRAILTTPAEGFVESDNYCMNYVQVPAFEPLPKAKDIIMAYEKNERSYKIALPEIKNAVYYKVEIYREESLKTLVFKNGANKPEMFWPSNRSGIYFLRYKVVDSKRRESGYSPISKIIFPISPLSNW